MTLFIFLLYAVSIFVFDDAEAATLQGGQQRGLGTPFGPVLARNYGWGHRGGIPDYEGEGPDDFYPDQLPPIPVTTGTRKPERPRKNGGRLGKQNNAVGSGSQTSGGGNVGNQNNGGSSSSQSVSSSGGENSGSTGLKTTQRPPMNVVMNENTINDPQIRDCIRNKCPSTNEYNPVCGNDNITYTNPTKFKCAQICRSSVQMNHRGACVTTPPSN